MFFSLCVFLKDFHVAAPASTFNVRKVELTPLEQRKLTFDSHAMVTELESHGENYTHEVRDTILPHDTSAQFACANKDRVRV